MRYLPLLLILATAPAFAQTESRVYFGGVAGTTIAPELSSDIYGAAIGVGASAGVMVTPELELGASGRITLQPLDEEAFEDEFPGFTVEGGDLNIIAGNVGIRYHFPSNDNAHFYALFEGGIRRLGSSSVTVGFGGAEGESDADSIIKGGITPGVGLIWATGGTSGLYLQAAYDFVFTDGDALQMLLLSFGYTIGS